MKIKNMWRVFYRVGALCLALVGFCAVAYGQLPAQSPPNLLAQEMYKPGEAALFWVGRADASARWADIAAAAHFIETQGLNATALRRALDAGQAVPPAQASVADLEITTRLIEAAVWLKAGKVSRTALGPDWGLDSPPPPSAAALAEAFASGRVLALFQSLTPTTAAYTGLVRALQQYADIADSWGWPTVPGRSEVMLDSDNAVTRRLAERLAVEDAHLRAWEGGLDLLRQGVMDFQKRYGLEPDGRIGVRTLAALNVPASARVAQIAANLERWRQLPRDLGATHVLVNAADGSLSLVVDGQVTMHMRAIIGDPDHPTPTFSSNLGGVTFNPSWTVPVSIATREMLPKLKSNPGYLAANDMIILGRESDPHGLQVDWHKYSARAFPFQLQQRPGPKNALGTVKFEMSNPYSVYLHDTPSRSLFARAKRNLSHGCIRLEQPRELAVKLLEHLSDWDEAAIGAAIAAGETQTVPLTRKIPVHIFYFTAFIDDDGRIAFRDDAYLRDPSIMAGLGFQSRVASAAGGSSPEFPLCDTF